MKVAFLFSGQVREIPINLFKQSISNLTKELDYDIFVYAWDEAGKSLNHSKNNIKKNFYINPSVYINELFEDFNLKSLQIENFQLFKENLKPYHKNIFNSKKYHFGTINAMPQIYMLSQCFGLIKGCLDDYDLIFKCRFDSLFIHPLNLYDLREIKNKNKIYTLNFGRAYYPNRIYDIFFGGSNDSMKFLSNIWNQLPYLVNNEFDNKLDKRDACRLLFLSARLNQIKVESFETRICDVFRNFKNNYYEKYLLSMHLIRLTKLIKNIYIIPYFYKWFIFREFNLIKVFFYFLKSLIISPISYLKRVKYFFKVS